MILLMRDGLRKPIPFSARLGPNNRVVKGIFPACPPKYHKPYVLRGTVHLLGTLQEILTLALNM